MNCRYQAEFCFIWWNSSLDWDGDLIACEHLLY